MYQQFNDMMKNMKITPAEVDRMTKAFEDPKFRELFDEYVREIENPENKARYEEDIRKMEEERGIEAKFIKPTPGHCLQTTEIGKNMPVYVNIASNELVDQAKCDRDKERKGYNWSLPHSMSPPRDIKTAKVFDVIFHPDTYRMGESNKNFMDLLRDTALDAIKSNWKVSLDKKFEVLSDKQYFGRIESCILRNKDGQKTKDADQPTLRPDLEKRKDLEKFIQKRNARSKSTIKGNRNPIRWEGREMMNDDGSIQPEFKIKQSKCLDIQDYVGNPKSGDRSQPDNLVVVISLPELKQSKNIKLDVQDKTLTLRTVDEEPGYLLKDLALPFIVDSKQGNAKYKKEAKLLDVTLPIVVEKVTFEDALNIHPDFLPDIPDPNMPVMSEKEQAEELRRIENEKRPKQNIALPDFKASESAKWCLFEINVGDAAVDSKNDVKITPEGFTITSEPFGENKDQVRIGLAISLGKDGVLCSESSKHSHEGFFEIKLRKTQPGLLKHYKMGKTSHSMDEYRFDALISDRQVEGDRSLPMANEPAVWVPKKEYADPKDRPVAKASKSARKR